MKTQQNGYADVLIGLQYGDEGKARVVDLLAKNYDIIARFNGGSNAGHCVEYKGQKITLHQIPSGIFYPDKKLYIGSGCVVNVIKLAQEIKEVEKLGISLKGRFRISSQAPIIQPHHLIIDQQTGGSIGTTKNGIGPCYGDRARRMIGDRLVNIRIGDLHNELDSYLSKIKVNLEKEIENYGVNLIFEKVDKAISDIKNAFQEISEYVEIDTLWMQKQVENNSKVLFEGAQSVMLDVAKGSIPFVTSSYTIASAAYSGGDLSVKYHNKVIGIAKAVMSRVGNGPFTSELGEKMSELYCSESNEDGTPKFTKEIEKAFDLESNLTSDDEFTISKALRVLGNEYGGTSSRPRRIGLFDLVQLKYAIRMNGVDELVITKVDMLSDFDRTKFKAIPVINKYIFKGREIDFIPASAASYYKVKGERLMLNTFSENIQSIKNQEDLPKNVTAFIDYIANYSGVKVVGIGVGPDRDQYVNLK
jgi:adenylosuccinate synthase